MLGMVPAQRPQDRANLRCDWPRDRPVALALLTDLPRVPIDLVPFQQAFPEPQPRCVGEAKKWEVVVAGLGFELLAFVTHKLAHALRRLLEPMLAPLRLVLEAHAPSLSFAEQLLELLGQVIDREGRDERIVMRPSMPSPPRYEPRHIVADEVGEQLVLAEELEQ